MVEQKSHNTFSIQGRVVGVPGVRMAKQGDGGYVDVTLNVIGKIWDANMRTFVPSTEKVPISFYSKTPSEDAGRLKSGYAVIIDGHVIGRSYTDSQGGKRLAADLRVDNVDIIEPLLGGGASLNAPGKPSLQAGYQAQQTEAPIEQFDDDQIPF